MTNSEQGQLRIGFVEHETTQHLPTTIRVYDLTKTLDAFQRSVYATAAFDMGRKRLTKEQRAEYAWAVKSFSHGSFWTDLVPFALLATTQLNLFNDAVSTIWTATQHTIELITTIASRKKQESPLALQNLPSFADIAKVALRSDKETKIELTSQDGTKLSFHTTPESSKLIVARRALVRGVLSKFSDCIVKDIKTTSPDIIVTIPQFFDNPIRCTYGKGNEQHITPHLNTYDKIAIIGAPIYDGDLKGRGIPDVIEIAYIENSQGEVISKPTLPFLLQQQLDDEDSEAVV